MEKNERVKPMTITDPDTNETYTLEFNRDSVRFAEQQGFKIGELTDFPATNIPTLFYLAFRKNHKQVSRAKAEELLEKMEGLTVEELERLVRLYHQTNDTLVLDTGAVKNRKMVVAL